LLPSAARDPSVVHQPCPRAGEQHETKNNAICVVPNIRSRAVSCRREIPERGPPCCEARAGGANAATQARQRLRRSSDRGGESPARTADHKPRHLESNRDLAGADSRIRRRTRPDEKNKTATERARATRVQAARAPLLRTGPGLFVEQSFRRKALRAPRRAPPHREFAFSRARSPRKIRFGDFVERPITNTNSPPAAIRMQKRRACAAILSRRSRSTRQPAGAGFSDVYASGCSPLNAACTRRSIFPARAASIRRLGRARRPKDLRPSGAFRFRHHRSRLR